MPVILFLSYVILTENDTDFFYYCKAAFFKAI